MKLRPVRRLHGLCFYCGRPGRRNVCAHCDDLPALDPYFTPIDQWLAARGHGSVRGCNRSGEWNFLFAAKPLPVRDPLVSKARQPLSETERFDSARLPERTP